MILSKPKKKKVKKLSDYKKKAWLVFSQYIRMRDSNNNWFAKCCTCEVVDEWKYLQAGHFVAGRNNSILFEETNVHAQCVGCNYFGRNAKHYGNYYEFMKAKYGVEEVDRLILLSNREVLLTKEDFEQIEEKYKQKIKDLNNGNKK